MKLGPTGGYPFDSPKRPYDRGGLSTEFAVHKNQGVCVLDFGTVVNWVFERAEEARQHAFMFREKIAAAFGSLPYDAGQLPFRVVANSEKQIIETYFPQPLDTLIANPHVFLAWAEKLDEAVDSLKQDKREIHKP